MQKSINDLSIRDIDVGAYAEFDGEILQVKKCVHNQKYYVYICDVRDKNRKLSSIEPEVVCDGDEDHLMYCCP